MKKKLIGSLEMMMADFKQAFDPVLQATVEKKIKNSLSHTNDEVIASIISHSKTLLMSGGKRIRPFIAHTIAQEDMKIMNPIPPILVALEIFHIFCLVHDDIIDHGFERHGVPAAQRFTTSLLKRHRRLGDLDHIGESQAILLGDLLNAWAFDLVGQQGALEPEKREKFYTIFHNMTEEVIIGQMLDVNTTTLAKPTTEDIYEKMTLKTARYSFVEPLKFGALMADRLADLETFCEDFGTKLGIAFQIQDDLLDITTDEALVSKFSDLRYRQHSIFTQFIHDHGTAKAKKELEETFGIGEKLNKRAVFHLFSSSGALQHGTSVMMSYYEAARALLPQSTLSTKQIEALNEFITLLSRRTS